MMYVTRYVKMIQFIENALASLHVSWYIMLFLTVVPVVLSIPRQLSLMYLLVYAISGACVIVYGIPEPQKKEESGNFLLSKMDDKTRIFQAIKLRGL